jgi:hypothetical protein
VNGRDVIDAAKAGECPAGKFDRARATPPNGSHRAGGPGTELAALLAKAGIKKTLGCGCGGRAKEMDRRGVDWCAANVGTIVGWMAGEASKRGLPFSRTVGGVLVRRAIKNARKKQQLSTE